jgi:hypothetical protein
MEHTRNEHELEVAARHPTTPAHTQFSLRITVKVISNYLEMLVIKRKDFFDDSA